jgi:hypothetical protein
MDLAREGHMTIRKVVIGLGLALMAFGIWTLARAHSQVGTCTTSGATGAASHSGLDSSCVQTLMSYSLGFVFVASGLIIAVIAFTMIAKQERLDLRGGERGPRRSARRPHAAPRQRTKNLNSPTRRLRLIAPRCRVQFIR